MQRSFFIFLLSQSKKIPSHTLHNTTSSCSCFSFFTYESSDRLGPETLFSFPLGETLGMHMLPCFTPKPPNLSPTPPLKTKEKNPQERKSEGKKGREKKKSSHTPLSTSMAQYQCERWMCLCWWGLIVDMRAAASYLTSHSLPFHDFKAKIQFIREN